MTEANTTGLFNFTAPAVLVFPNLFEAKKFKKNGKEAGEAKYGGTLILSPDHADLAALKARAIAVAKAKWPGRDLQADFKNGELRMPWQSGDKLAEKRVKKLTNAGKDDDGKGDFQKGKVVIKTSSKYQPRLSVINAGKIVDLEESTFTAHKSKFYSGTQVLAQVNLVPYDGVGEDGKDGVTAYLNMVLTLNKGERIGGSGPAASEVFKGYVGNVTDEDPTGGNLDDNEGF